MVQRSSLKKASMPKPYGRVTEDMSYQIASHPDQLYPMSPQSVMILPSDSSLLGYSTHSDSSASFDVRSSKQFLGNPPLHRADSSTEPSASSSSLLAAATPAAAAAKKCVSFSNEVEVHPIVHRNDLDDDEKTVQWYGNKELKRMRKECRVTVRLIREGLLIRDTDDHCLLGLDGETHPYAHQRDIHKLMVQDLVFGEQERQRELGEFDPEGLSEMVADLRSRCRHAKFISGLRDDLAERRGIIN